MWRFVPAAWSTKHTEKWPAATLVETPKRPATLSVELAPVLNVNTGKGNQTNRFYRTMRARTRRRENLAVRKGAPFPFPWLPVAPSQPMGGAISGSHFLPIDACFWYKAQDASLWLGRNFLCYRDPKTLFFTWYVFVDDSGPIKIPLSDQAYATELETDIGSTSLQPAAQRQETFPLNTREPRGVNIDPSCQ